MCLTLYLLFLSSVCGNWIDNKLLRKGGGGVRALESCDRYLIFCYVFYGLVSLSHRYHSPLSTPSRVTGCRKLNKMLRGNCTKRLSILVALVGGKRARSKASC